MNDNLKLLRFSLPGLILLCCTACHRNSDAQSAFYFWKTAFSTDGRQRSLVREVAENRLYLRFFDVDWNEGQQMVLPHAILEARESLKDLHIVPVVFITNRTFEKVRTEQADSLAFKVNLLLGKIAHRTGVSYSSVQVDCDWTLGTRQSYFAFLLALKRYSTKQLQATIRLHQVKYRDRTGIPPVDKGILMFYNMGTLSPNLTARNSIYNAADAEKYVSYLQTYPLPLDVALPVFSWSLQIRGDKIIKLYGKLNSQQFADTTKFEDLKSTDAYRAKESFYVNGIYVKAGDVFKLEDVSRDRLFDAAQQVAHYLKPLKKRNIIYYEISSVNLTSVDAKDIQKATAYF